MYLLQLIALDIPGIAIAVTVTIFDQHCIRCMSIAYRDQLSVLRADAWPTTEVRQSLVLGLVFRRCVVGDAQLLRGPARVTVASAVVA